MSDPNNEPGIPLTAVPGHVASHPHLNTIRRWAKRGVRGVRLRSWLVGGRRFTSPEAITEFIRALNQASGGARC
jgi:hypothetical protein